MTGKIERPQTAARAKVERTQVETPAKTAAVTRTSPQVKTEFSSEAPNALTATGNHVAISARPDTLWGGSERRGGPDSPSEILKLTPAQQTEKLVQLTAQRDALQAKVLARISQLDLKFENSTTKTKAEAMREYAEVSDQLDPETRQELRQMARQAEQAQRRIDRLVDRREGMPPSRNATPETKAARAALAAELRAARKEQRDAVKEAVKVVDEQGLKVDRLGVTEQVIDPKAPKPGTDGSLLGMVKNLFSFNWVTEWLGTIVSSRKEKKLDLAHEQQLQQQLLVDHQADQAAKREGLRELAIEAAARKRS